MLLRCMLLLLLLVPAAPVVAQPEDTQIAAGKFLVASSYWMRDPRFRSSVILLVKHDKDGTLGLILNHPTKLTVHQALPEHADALHASSSVYIGGPVAPSTFLVLVRTNKRSEGLLRVMNNVAFSADADTIKEWLATESRASRIRVFAGYSGWSAGQLEGEMKLGGWRLFPANASAVFDSDPENLWPELSNQRLQQTWMDISSRSRAIAALLPFPYRSLPSFSTISPSASEKRQALSASASADTR